MILNKQITTINKFPGDEQCTITPYNIVVEYEVTDPLLEKIIERQEKIEEILDELDGSIIIESGDPSLSYFQRLYEDGYFNCMAITNFNTFQDEIAEYMEHELPGLAVKNIHFI